MSGDFVGWVFLAVLGAIAGGVGYGGSRFALSHRRAKARLARISASQTTTVFLAPVSGTVELAGTAVPLDDASLVEAPLSGTRCLWWRVSIEEVNGSSIVRVASRSDARDFYLDDGSGAVARVRAATATLGLTTRNTNPAYEERAKRFLAELKIKKAFDTLLWFEERIDLHTEVYVLGTARLPDGGKSPGGPFRPEGPRERLVVEAPDGGELVVSVGHEAALAAKLATEIKEASDATKITIVCVTILTAICAALLYSLVSDH